MPDHTCHDGTHLVIGQTKSQVSIKNVTQAKQNGNNCEVAYSTTYFLPMQFLGPVEKGLSASFLSFAYCGGGSGSHRSGTND